MVSLRYLENISVLSLSSDSKSMHLVVPSLLLIHLLVTNGTGGKEYRLFSSVHITLLSVFPLCLSNRIWCLSIQDSLLLKEIKIYANAIKIGKDPKSQETEWRIEIVTGMEEKPSSDISLTTTSILSHWRLKGSTWKHLSIVPLTVRILGHLSLMFVLHLLRIACKDNSLTYSSWCCTQT
jgi:hypothetical protein